MRVKGSTGVRQDGPRTEIITSLVTALGGTMVGNDDNISSCDLFIQWGLRRTKNFRQCLREGMVSIMLDRGYFDSTRFETFSISVQGVHGLSMPVPGVIDLPIRPCPELQPWKDTGEFVQIIAPGWNEERYWRTPSKRLPESWVSDIAREASETFGLPAKIRYHPRAMPEGYRRLPPLDTTFEETAVSVGYSSLSAVQTVIAGVPTVVIHPRSPAFIMGCSYMGIVRPDRTEWLHELSHRQYRMDDIAGAVEYIRMTYEAAKEKGPLVDPLLQYGIKE